MGVDAIVAAVGGLVVVTGYLALAWLRGRPASYQDDASVLLGGPPPEMTAATATIIDEGPTQVAFMAALLDLASRDEIRFHDEGLTGGRSAVGIEIRGGDTDDARAVRVTVGEARGTQPAAPSCATELRWETGRGRRDGPPSE